MQITKKINVNVANPAGYGSIAEVSQAMSVVAGLAKTQLSVCNNIAYIVTGNVIDSIKKTNLYRHEVKKLVKRIHKEWQDYEKRLLYADYNRLFHVAAMDKKQQTIYADITDRDYFEFWQATGMAAYGEVLPFVDALTYKYKKPMAERSVRHSDILSQLNMLHASLQVCEYSFKQVVEKCVSDSRLPKEAIVGVIGGLSVSRIAKSVRDLIDRLTDEGNTFDLTDSERKNITLGVTQYTEKVCDPQFIIESIRIATEDYAEMFRTKGYQKKALGAIAEAHQIVEKDKKEYKRKKLLAQQQ